MSSSKLELWDIFSYSCMNCLRSLDYIKQLDKKYKKYGLKTVIIHVPEWKFEKDNKNIGGAIRQYNITFQKVVDKDKKLLRKLKVSFWPSQILIKGKKEVYRHIGEGSYMALENKIIKELKINKKNIKALFGKEPEYSKCATVYTGSRKNGKFLELNNKTKIRFGAIYANNAFIQKEECLESIGNGILRIKTKGKIINMVAESLIKRPIRVCVGFGGKKTSIRIKGPRLYTIAKSKNNDPKVLEITGKGIAIYSFSFL